MGKGYMDSSKFSSLKLPKSMIDNLDELGYNSMTKIQESSLPHILQGKDIVAQAKTGSGKTAAFGIGILNNLKVKKFRVQTLVLCPTRELADQVAKEIRRLARFAHNIKVLTLCGGMPLGPQIGSLRHLAHIVVGTPGRILQHLEMENLSLKDISSVVFDEADRMLDMGFMKEIDQIHSYLPRVKQTLLFSATFPPDILKLSKTIQDNPINIKTVDKEVKNEIEQIFYKVEKERKLEMLLNCLAHHKPENVIIFSNRKIESEEISEYLCDRGVSAKPLHGDLEQQDRNEILLQFANRSFSVLVATDVAARGLDIKELDMVINFDIPQEREVYTHRIGRTARAGESGVAITLYTERQRSRVKIYDDGVNSFQNSEDLESVEMFLMDAPNSTLMIGAGKKYKIRPADILGALVKEAGIDFKYIGKIDIFDFKSYVAIDRAHIGKAKNKLQRGRIKAKKFYVTIIR